VWIAQMREWAAHAERTEAQALARRERNDVEDAEFEDRPVRALERPERVRAEPVVREIVYERGSSWMPLAIGLGIVALIGVAGVVVYLLVRRKDNGETSVLGAIDPRYVPQLQQQVPQVYLINAGSGQAQVVKAEPANGHGDSAMLSMLSRIEAGIDSLVNHNKVPYNQSTMRTYRLPWLADASNPAVRIATAGNASMEAVVRVVSPPGALAAFSFSPNELNITQTVVAPGLSTVPAGDTLVVPAGQQQQIHMNPRQVLYAKGNISPTSPTGPVVVSISTVDNYVSR
jgi:hypothetical protein